MLAEALPPGPAPVCWGCLLSQGLLPESGVPQGHHPSCSAVTSSCDSHSYFLPSPQLHLYALILQSKLSTPTQPCKEPKQKVYTCMHLSIVRVNTHDIRDKRKTFLDCSSFISRSTVLFAFTKENAMGCYWLAM